MRTLRSAGVPDSAIPDMGVAAVARRRVVVRDCARHSIRRRRMTGRAMQVICLIAVLIGVTPLVALVIATVSKGAGALSIGFLLHAPTPEGVPGGGISTAIVGSGEIVAYAVALAVPLGLFIALFLFERAGAIASSIRFSADVMSGVPSIIIGIFAYAVYVERFHHFSNVAAGFALGVLMLPIMVRANEEAMRTVSVDLWEAGISLGARRSRVARSVVLRGALPGVVTGNLLALARGVGETAPLLFTVASPTFAMTLLIFNDATQPFPDAQQTAWGTALVLLTLVLILSVTARTIAWTLNRKTR
ncbi:MAG: phosphate ABC transporter permease PstA [Acidimicrobiales bacterium]